MIVFLRLMKWASGINHTDISPSTQHQLSMISKKNKKILQTHEQTNKIKTLGKHHRDVMAGSFFWNITLQHVHLLV